MFKKIIVTATLAGVAVTSYIIMDRLSADALAMAVGILFGVMAGIPTALMMLAANRTSEPSAIDYWRQRALESEARTTLIQARLAGLIDDQGTIVKTMSQDIF